MNRLRFYNKAVVDGVEQLDVIDNSLSKFTMNYPTYSYIVNETDLLRPDMISYKCFGSVRYWWVICMVNDILNPFSDIVTGKVLTIPSIKDILDFERKYKVR